MKIELLAKSEDSLEFKLVDGDASIAVSLVNALLMETDVVSARYYLGHPEKDHPVVSLKVKENAKAAKVLKNVSQKLSKKYSSMSDSFVLGPI